jgi:hypothetical protein
MPAEEDSSPGERSAENAPSVAERSNGKGGKTGFARPGNRAASPRKPIRRESPPNAIQASRRSRRGRREPAATARAEGMAVHAPSDPPAEAPSGSPTTLQRADSDPWTVPQSVRDRFIQDGHRFHFPDGALAFKDQGRRLTTPSENTQVVVSLIEIAHSRGWTEVTVTGTERFRHEAWRQARIAGLAVRGYRPSEAEQAQLIRAMAGTRLQSQQRVDSISVDPVASPPRELAASAPAPGTAEATRARIAGKLLDHGRDTYRHDPNEEPSYFVRLQTRDGTREIWGKDIERAVASSLTQPQLGDQVILQRTGRDAVTVKRQERGSDGQLNEKALEVFRNRWVIEKEEFFEQRTAAARVIRNEAIGAREAVRAHPELAGTYLNLRAAELASQRLRDPEDQRRFLAHVRAALADHIERGEPLQPVRLRERRTSPISKDRASPAVEQARG